MRTVIFLLIFLLYIGGNYFIYSNISRTLPTFSFWRFVLMAVVIVGVVSFFAYMLFHDDMPYKASKLMFFLGTTWLNFFFYLFLITIASSIILLINRYIPLFPRAAINHYTRENILSLLLIIGFISALLVGGHLKYMWKKQVMIPIQLDKTMRSDSLHGDSLRIVGISDLHLGYGIGASELQEWVRLINNEQPDIVLIAGNIVDISTKPLMRDSLYKYFKEIQAPLGIYACFGNHEYYAGTDKSAEFYKMANIHLLRDQVALIDSTFYVIGRDDSTNPKRLPLSKLTKGLDASKPVILLDHQPNELTEAEKEGIDLQFSGHTHEGQIWPFSYLTKMMFANSHGYLQKGKSHFYISSGIGIWGGKFRIGTQSEFVVFKLRGANLNPEYNDNKK